MDLEAYLNTFLNTIEQFALTNPWLSYFLLFLSAFIENVFPPIPGDMVTVFGAYLVGKGSLEMIPVILSTSLGSILGFMTLFYLGYHFGRDFFIKKNYRFFPVSMINKATEWFVRFGYLIVLANRFLAAIRTVISISAGIAKMNPLVVLLLSSIAVLVWNGLLIYFGYLLGDNWQQVSDYLARYSQVVTGIIVALLLFFTVRWIIKRRKAA